MQNQKRRCFMCNGTGLMCDVCGEAEDVCACPDDEKSPVDCEDCKGTGIASADLDDK